MILPGQVQMVQLGSDCQKMILPGGSDRIGINNVIQENYEQNQLGDRCVTAVQHRGWARVKTAARYADVSERTLRGWLKDGLGHIRLDTGTILIKYSWIDEYLEKHTVNNNDQIDTIVSAALKGVLRMKGTQMNKIIKGSEVR